jgi:hypothetical protein
MAAQDILETPALVNPIPGDNRHPIDALVDVRDKIKELEVQEKLLKDAIQKSAPEGGRIMGAEYEARIEKKSRRSITVGDAEKVLLPEIFDKLVKTTTATFVYVDPISKSH